MDILFRSPRWEKECNDSRLLSRRQGAVRAKLIRRRLDELAAADTLAVLRTLPQARCHELKGDRAGQLSVDLDGPYRLLFEVANNPRPQKPDGGLDWPRVTAVRILGIEDTHE
jgi:proteic killer suppression protein